MNPGVLVPPAVEPSSQKADERHPARQSRRARRRARRGGDARRRAAARARHAHHDHQRRQRGRIQRAAAHRGARSAPTPSSSPAATAPSTSPFRNSPAPASRSASSRSGPATTWPRTLGLRELDVAAAADAIVAGRTRADRPRPRHPRRRQLDVLRHCARERLRLEGQRPRECDALAARRVALQHRDPDRVPDACRASRTRSSSILADGTRERIVGDLVMATVGNGRTYGGGIPICPDADPADGLLDVDAGATRGPSAAAAAAPARLQGHAHDGVPEVSTHRVRSVRLSSPGVTAYADGDPIGALPLTIDVAPASLTRLHAARRREPESVGGLRPRAVARAPDRAALREPSPCRRAPRRRSACATTSASSWQLGAVLEVLGDVGLLGLADLVAQVLLEVASRLLTAAVGHFVLLVAAALMPRSFA